LTGVEEDGVDMKFLDVKTDYAFKKVFGSEKSKPQLISFLNAILVFQDEHRIEDLTIVDPYSIPLIKGMKDTYVDVKAVLDDGSCVIIEMQVLNVKAFEQRILYNAAKAYSTQLIPGDNYNLLNPVIALTITDFVMFPETEQLITRFKLLEKQKLISYSDDLELVFVELPKFNKSPAELETITDRWLYFVKNAGEMKVVPENMEPEIRDAFDSVNEAALTREELELQHKQRDYIWLQKSSIEKALETGIRQGLEQGLEQGRELGLELGAKERDEVVRARMKAAGMSDDQISDILD
jgi:predicted transposase/invertase (TIGR01784 family)